MDDTEQVTALYECADKWLNATRKLFRSMNRSRRICNSSEFSVRKVHGAFRFLSRTTCEIEEIPDLRGSGIPIRWAVDEATYCDSPVAFCDEVWLSAIGIAERLSDFASAWCYDIEDIISDDELRSADDFRIAIDEVIIPCKCNWENFALLLEYTGNQLDRDRLRVLNFLGATSASDSGDGHPQAWPDSLIEQLRQNQKLLALEMNEALGAVDIAEFARKVGWLVPFDNNASSLIARFNQRLESLGSRDRIHQHDGQFKKKA